jgi:ABC-type amino acid transport substrate-binding protein
MAKGTFGRLGNWFSRLGPGNSGTVAYHPLIAAFLALGLAVGTLHATAADSQRVTYAFYPYPPIAMMADERRSGYATEIMTEALRRAGFEIQETDLPGLRALAYIEKEAGIFISGTKTPEAYDKYAVAWPFCFETVTHTVIVPANKGPNSFAELPRNAQIGAFISYTLKDYLAQQGFTNLHLARENHQLAQMLMSDRIDAWASFDSSARYLLEGMGVDLRSIRSLPIKQFSFCAVTSRKTERSVLNRVKAAYQSMITDGTRAAIRARYQRYLGPDSLPDPATWEQRPEPR